MYAWCRVKDGHITCCVISSPPRPSCLSRDAWSSPPSPQRWAAVFLYVRALRGHTGGEMIALELMGHVANPYIRKEFLFHRGCSYNVQSILKSGLVAGGRESKQGRQTIFFTPLNPSGQNPDEEKFNSDFSKLRKVHYESKWKANQDAVYWISLARAKDKGSQFRQTRSHAIIVCSSVPSRPAPKIVLESALAVAAAARHTGRSNFDRDRETVARRF